MSKVNTPKTGRSVKGGDGGTAKEDVPGKAAREGSVSEEGPKGAQLIPGEVKARGNLVGCMWPLDF